MFPALFFDEVLTCLRHDIYNPALNDNDFFRAFAFQVFLGLFVCEHFFFNVGNILVQSKIQVEPDLAIK